MGNCATYVRQQSYFCKSLEIKRFDKFEASELILNIIH